MSPPDHRDARHPEPGEADALPAADSLRDDTPLSDELCLFVRSLELDGRAVPPVLAERVAARLAERPALRRAADDFLRQREALAAAPRERPAPDFAERVLAARRRAAPRPILRRLAAAAALLLGASLVWDVTHPAALRADPDTARTRWIVDELQPDPFGPARVEAALREQLPGPLDGADPAREVGARPAPAEPVDGEPGEPDRAPADRGGDGR